MQTLRDYVYLNGGKVDSLFAQLNGNVINEKKEIVQKGVKGLGKLGVEIGGILAKLGLAKGTAEAELSSDYSKILEITTTLSVENKLDVLQEYSRSHGQLADVVISSWSDTPAPPDEYDAICSKVANTKFQLLAGLFRLRIGTLDQAEAADALMDVWRARQDTKFEPTHREFELFSVRTQGDERQPLVTVPLFFAHLVPNQGNMILLKAEGITMYVFANCIVRQNALVANPIGVSISY